jgi:hypothetical protein
MGIEIIASILSGVVSLVAGGLASTVVTERHIRRILGRGDTSQTTVNYQDRLSELTESLSKSSAEVDSVLAEIAHVSAERAKAVSQLEQELATLEQQERELQTRIQALQSVPIPVAEHFAALTAAGDKRSARRDYLLFAAGVVVSTGIAIVLHLAGLA